MHAMASHACMCMHACKEGSKRLRTPMSRSPQPSARIKSCHNTMLCVVPTQCTQRSIACIGEAAGTAHNIRTPWFSPCCLLATAVTPSATCGKGQGRHTTEVNRGCGHESQSQVNSISYSVVEDARLSPSHPADCCHHGQRIIAPGG